jgi:hypothetical protein
MRWKRLRRRLSISAPRMIGNTAESLLKAEKAMQDKLAQQLMAAEADNIALRSDLGFFEKLLPAGAVEALKVRGLQAELPAPGQLRFQLLVMQAGKALAELKDRYDIALSGTLGGKPWLFSLPAGSQPLQFKQYVRIDGIVDHPAQAVVKAVSLRVVGLNGALKASLNRHAAAKSPR